MEPTLIDLSNYDIALVQSSASRSGAPDGNFFFDTTGKVEFIRADELATVDLSGGITTGAIQLDVVASAGTITRSSGSFIDDGFKAGRSFAFSGFTNGGNNSSFVPSNVTALVITVVDNTGMADETGSGDEVGASEVEANPLTTQLGIKFEGIYAFENQERRLDEELRKFDRWTSGTFKFGGAYSFENSRKPSTDADRNIIRGSGWSEYASDGGTDRIYFGNKGLSNIESGSQPYYMLSASATPVLNDIVPVNFAKTGQIDEAIQVFGDTGNTPSDAGAGDFDTRAYENTSLRTFGKNFDRKETTTDLGITELGGYSTGFALNESDHLTSGSYALADVYGVGQVTPWTGMTLEKLAVAVNKDEFQEAAGDFTWVLNNSVPGDLNQMVAFLDALSQTDDDIDTGSESDTKGKRVGTWYYYDAAGKVISRSGADSLGLYFYAVPTADKQRVKFTDDAGSLKTYAFEVQVEANIGAIAKADVLAWYHGFLASGYNTAGATTIQDSSSQDVKGLASSADVDNKIVFSYNYTVDTDCVFLCEGDGGATQAKTLFTIIEQTTIAFACAPGVENNA